MNKYAHGHGLNKDKGRPGGRKYIDEWEIEAMLKVAEGTRYPIRNRGLVLLATDAGLSPLEMSYIRREHLFRPEGGLSDEIDLRGKPGAWFRPRVIPMPRHGRLWNAMHTLIENVPATPRDPLIISERATPGGGATKQPGTKDLRAMRSTSISYVLWKLMAKAGIAGASALTCRTTFIVKLGQHARKSELSLRNVQELAGYRSLDSLEQLLEANERDQRAMVEDLFGSKG
jgi:hypothetical protein